MEPWHEKQTSSSVCKDCGDFKKKIQDMKNILMLQAIRDGHAGCVEEAVHEGAGVNATDISLRSAGYSVVDCLHKFDVHMNDFIFDSRKSLYDFHGEPAVCIAVWYDKQDCLEALIKAGADVNSRSCYDDTSLILAARFGVSIGFMGVLIKAGADVNAQNTVNLIRDDSNDIPELQLGDTALIIAVQRQRSEWAEGLIAAGADVNILGNNGKTALVDAVECADDRCVEVLIKSGADVNVHSIDGETALFTAVRKGLYIEQLIQAGADVNYRASILLSQAANGGTLTTQQSLFRSGIIINTSAPSVLTCQLVRQGHTDTDAILLLAAAGEKMDEAKVRHIPEYLKPKEICLKHLCREAIRKHLLNLDPHTHLFYRVPRLPLPSLITDYLLYNVSLDKDFGLTHAKKTEILTNKESREEKQALSSACGVLKKQIQDMKNTLLLQAVRAGHADCVEKALSEGADVNASDTSLENTVHLVFDCLNQFDVKLDDIQFDRVCRGRTAICIAVINNRLDCLEVLIKTGADVNLSCRDGPTPLMFAVFDFNCTILDVLIKAEADVNAQINKSLHDRNESTDQLGNTALIVAVRNHAVDCVKSLIAAGADVNRRGSNGNTALVEAIEAAENLGFDDGCLQLLITEVNDLNITNTNNESPLLLAVNKEVLPHVEQLIEAGADVNCQASKVLWYVVVEGTLSMLQSLLRAGININTSKPSVLTSFLETFGTLEPSVVLTLAAAGERIDEGSVEIPGYLKPKETCLKHLCREAVRNHLLNLDPHTHLFSRIPRLKLPSLMTDYLLYNVSLDDDCFLGPC